jgi:hypothetical protein
VQRSVCRLVHRVRGRKLTRVRPKPMIVATCVSRKHAKETCVLFRTLHLHQRQESERFRAFSYEELLKDTKYRQPST